eukprot:325880-Chlamydomonas_euryale.AAC.12
MHADTHADSMRGQVLQLQAAAGSRAALSLDTMLIVVPLHMCSCLAVFSKLQDFLPKMQAANEHLEGELKLPAGRTGLPDSNRANGLSAPLLNSTWKECQRAKRATTSKWWAVRFEARTPVGWMLEMQRTCSYAMDLACGLVDLKDDAAVQAAEAAAAVGGFEEPGVFEAYEGGNCSSSSGGSSSSDEDSDNSDDGDHAVTIDRDYAMGEAAGSNAADRQAAVHPGTTSVNGGPQQGKIRIVAKRSQPKRGANPKVVEL